MYKAFVFVIVIIGSFLFTGCGNGNGNSNELESATEENVSNFADGTVWKHTHVIEEEYLLSHYYGAEDSAEKGKLILMLQKNIYGLQEGDVVIVGKTGEFPNGLIRKVESVKEKNDSVKVVTAQAALGEAFKDLNLTYSMKLKPAPILNKNERNIGSGDVIRVLHEEEGVSLSTNADLSKNHDFTITLNDVDLGHGVTLNGSMDISLAFHMKINFYHKCTHRIPYTHICDGWKIALGHTYFYIEPKESGEVTLSASKDYSIKKIRTLATYEFPSITILVGAVPVVLDPELDFKVGAKGEVTAGMSVGFTERLSAQVGITHKKKGHHRHYGWYAIRTMHHDFKMIQPQFDANSEVKVSTGPGLVILLYGLTGPSAYADAYLKANVDLEADPWWALYYGIEANAGYTLQVLGHDFADVSYTIYDYQKPLAHAKGKYGE